ncbi:MAG: hypothetical protein ABIK31_02060 [candidate division WOR-3 bacterium]
MHIIENVTYHYCGNCNNGFKQVLIRPGEFALTPCECKIKQDKELIYRDFFSHSGVKIMTYVSTQDNKVLTFDNSHEWFNDIHIPLRPELYTQIYANNFANTSTKIMLPIQFHYEIGNKDFREHKESYILFEHLQKYRYKKIFNEFYINFLGDLLLRRLYKVKLIPFHMLLSKILDYNKSNFFQEIDDFSILLFSEFFSDDMMAAIKSDYKFDRIVQFLYTLFGMKKYTTIFQSDKYIVDFGFIPVEEYGKIVKQRAYYILEILLNHSYSVLLIN